ncbi:MAG: plasmid mobilization relaxosome protein MobC [Bacteroidota bacterium]|uniref:MobC family plasmid mobilization relaxosome protein n=1 Tax=Pedobacter cryotolerans TaxID=2571270 RepID=A0A4U1C8E8_9SPHI|nr:plasmid mobilization relaxosome protein MobC [Pedobacter cryotolerans]TKC01865.1 MobC family plasmid mobilization relaxosome protein [Pedobacter cryotolerans]
MQKEDVDKRAKGGRPLKKVKREKNVRVRLTAGEHFRIEDKASKARMNISEWIRRAAIRAKVAPSISPEEMKNLRMLSGMANNLNQLAKLAHSQGLIVVQRKCRELIELITITIKNLGKDDR